MRMTIRGLLYATAVAAIAAASLFNHSNGWFGFWYCVLYLATVATLLIANRNLRCSVSSAQTRFWYVYSRLGWSLLLIASAAGGLLHHATITYYRILFPGTIWLILVLVLTTVIAGASLVAPVISRSAVQTGRE